MTSLKRFLAVLVLAPLLVAGGTAWANELKNLRKEIEELKATQRELLKQQEAGDGVSSFISKRFRIGGYYEHTVLGMTGPDTKTQVSASDGWFSLNVGADINDRIQFILQSTILKTNALNNEHNNPAHGIAGFSTTRTFGALIDIPFITNARVEYALSPAFRIQAGMGNTPFGIAPQISDLTLFVRRGGPLYNAFTGTNYGAIVDHGEWNGLHLLGEFNLRGGHRIGYNVYSKTAWTDRTIVTGGSRLWWATPGDKAKLGVSHFTGKRTAASTFAASGGLGFYHSFGGDLTLKLGRFGATSEFVYSVANGADPWSVYAEPYVEFFDGEFLVFAAVDYFDNPLGVTVFRSNAAAADPFKKFEYAAGVNWLPWPFLRTRAALRWHDYRGATAVVAGQDRDYYSLDLSAGVAF